MIKLILRFLAVLLMANFTLSCTWSRTSAGQRQTYILGFGVVTRPEEPAGAAPQEAWIQDMRGIGMGLSTAGGPTRLHLGAFESHETALPKDWQGVIEYRQNHSAEKQ